MGVCDFTERWCGSPHVCVSHDPEKVTKLLMLVENMWNNNKRKVHLTQRKIEQ